MSDWIKYELEWLRTVFQALAIVDGALVAYAAQSTQPSPLRVAAGVLAIVALLFTGATIRRVYRLIRCVKKGTPDDCE